MCPVCRGRGEVSAGVASGTFEYGPIYDAIDYRGRTYPSRAAYPTSIKPNPFAVYPDTKEIWFLETNPHCQLWGIAVCARCRGSGA